MGEYEEEKSTTWMTHRQKVEKLAKERSKERKERGRRICLWVLLSGIFVFAFAGLLVLWAMWQKRDLHLEDASTLPTESTEDTPQSIATEEKTLDPGIDFSRLQEKNPDIYAWIYVPDTQVNYPILQSAMGVDTDYYLEHNLDGSTGLPGCIYTQQCNAKDFTDLDTVVYGHNMKDDSMFGSLHAYEDACFFQEHPYIYVFTPEETLVYQIFIAYETDNRLILDYYDYFQSVEVYGEYLEELQGMTGANCNVNRALEVTTEDRILTLSTCTGDEQYRYLIIGKALSKEEIASIGTEDIDNFSMRNLD